MKLARERALGKHYTFIFPESVLRLCLSSTSCKHGGPSLDHLLLHPLFVRAPLNGLYMGNNDVRTHLKFPIALKDELKSAVANSEARLKSEQKLVCCSNHKLATLLLFVVLRALMDKEFSFTTPTHPLGIVRG